MSTLACPAHTFTHICKVFFFFIYVKLKSHERFAPNDENSTLESNLCSSSFFFSFFSYIICMYSVRWIDLFALVREEKKFLSKYLLFDVVLHIYPIFFTPLPLHLLLVLHITFHTCVHLLRRAPYKKENER